jgi:peroxiredoxin
MKRTLIVLGILIITLGAIFSLIYFGGASLVLNVAGQNASDTSVSGAGLLGKRLPYFDLPELAGERVRSTDFADTPLVLVFWSTWNAQSADQMHILDQYLGEQSSQNRLVKIVAIDSQEERSVVSSFMNRGGYQVPTLLDAQGIASEQYGIKGLPAFFFVDRAGIVREALAGTMSRQALMNKIEKIVQ